MQIINVVEIAGGVLTSLVSFPIQNDMEEYRKVKDAEKLFLTLAHENGMLAEDDAAALDDGNFDDNNGYEVLLTWSEIK